MQVKSPRTGRTPAHRRLDARCGDCALERAVEPHGQPFRKQHAAQPPPAAPPHAPELTNPAQRRSVAINAPRGAAQLLRREQFGAMPTPRSCCHPSTIASIGVCGLPAS
eukprot:360365-Chlamydomonas_euryale.AAC.9